MHSLINLKNQRQLVINWHVTEACNYRCSYCYAHWKQPVKNRDLMHNEQDTRSLLVQLFAFFHPKNASNPLCKEMCWDSVRLNLAGGEPLLKTGRALDLINLAKEIGFDVSIITNASRLDGQTLTTLAPKISMIGISLDSGHETVNRAIGRIDRHGRVLALDNLSNAIANARLINPNLSLKINTVVNALNYRENMIDIINGLAPNKWKVLKMLPIVTHNLEVSTSQFNEFVERHSSLHEIINVENNDSLTDSYIMIDPKGRFFQNTSRDPECGYYYSRPILQTGVDKSFSDLTFSARKFLSRYNSSDLAKISVR
jgi:radical S-adenosyl methionine domain-containing protein 2